MPTLSQKLTRIQPSTIVQINNKVRELQAAGRKIINFGIGVPNFLPPAYVYEAAHKAVDADTGQYLSNRGTDELITAFQSFLNRKGSIFTYKKEEVCATLGAKSGLHALFLAMLNRDERVVFPSPHWTSYVESIEMADGIPTPLYAGVEQNYKITPEQLDAALTPADVRVFLFNNPANPTGMLYTKEEVKALGDVLERHPDVWIISDDIYDKLVYTAEPCTHLLETNPDLKSRLALTQSVSKTYGMPGWRVGMIAAPKEVVDVIMSISANIFMNVPNIPMAAAAAALAGNDDYFAPLHASFQKRRDLTMEALKSIPNMPCPQPEGAFYAFPNVSAYYGKTYKGTPITDDVTLCTLLLEHKSLALIPGSAFGDPNALRISYTCPEADLVEGLARFVDFFKEVQ